MSHWWSELFRRFKSELEDADRLEEAGWPITAAMLRGIWLSTDTAENGMSIWTDSAIDRLIRDGDVGNYYRHELGLPLKPEPPPCPVYTFNGTLWV